MLPPARFSNFSKTSSQDLGIEKLLELDAINSHEKDHYFYSIFSNKKSGSVEQLNALIFLATRTPQIRAALPIFEEASDEYIQIVVYGIEAVLATGKKDDKAHAFLHLISSSQNDQLPESIRNSLLLNIAAFNEAKKLNGLDLHDMNLNRLDLSKLNLQFSNLSGASLCGAKLIEANLANVNLSKAFFPNADLSNANLMGVNMIFATLSGANLTNVNLVGSNLSDALLNDVDLTNANLTFVNLINTDLNSANLTNAKLDKVWFKNTKLTGATQIGTSLKGARYLHQNDGNKSKAHHFLGHFHPLRG